MSVLFMVGTCVGTGIAIRVLRSSPRLVWAATFIGTMLLMLFLAGGSGDPIDLFGRILALDTSERIFLWPAALITGILALFGPLETDEVEASPSALLSNVQGAFFFASLAPLVVAMGIDSFPLAAVFWAIGLIFLVLASEPRREGRVGGSAQFLFLTVIAASSLLLSNRFLELYPLTPENQNLVKTAFLLLVWGLGLLLAIAPLHIWIGPLSDEMPLLGVTFLVGVAQPVGLWLLIQLMNRTLWLIEKSPLLDVLLYGGILTMPVGAVLALAERRHGRLLADVSLVSLGNLLIGLGLGTKVGLAGALIMLLNRGIGMTLLAAGLTFIRSYDERRWQQVGAFSVLAAALALAGLPPMPGFPGEWAVLGELAGRQPLLVIVLIASNAAILLSMLRLVRPIFVNRDQDPGQGGDIKLIAYLSTVVIVMLLVIMLIVGLFPQWVADPLLSLLASASYLK